MEQGPCPKSISNSEYSHKLCNLVRPNDQMFTFWSTSQFKNTISECKILCNNSVLISRYARIQFISEFVFDPFPQNFFNNKNKWKKAKDGQINEVLVSNLSLNICSIKSTYCISLEFWSPNNMFFPTQLNVFTFDKHFRTSDNSLVYSTLTHERIGGQ